jgi:NADH-quinone oxidoreductase subunit J
MSTVLIIFYILSAVSLSTAFMTIFSRNPIHSAIYLVICFFSIAGHFLLFNAQFLALVHVIVYSGAIMILLLFTLMLMNLNKEDEVYKPRFSRLGAVISVLATCGILLSIFLRSKPIMGNYDTTGKDYQSIKVLGQVLLDQDNGFMVPFEFVSVLLIVAMIGAVLLSKKENSAK